MEKEMIDKFVGQEDMPVVEVMKRIDCNANGILFIVNDKQQLVGSLSDGDIRRWIIRTGNLSGIAKEIMNTGVNYTFEGEEKKARQLMECEKLHIIPILNNQRQIVDILFDHGKTGEEHEEHDNALKHTPVIVMAGGKGTRLYPYTKILPKPLIPIGDIPILERILDKFHMYGTEEFFLTVNYRKEMIKSYFNEIHSNYSIFFIEEDQPLGTAGSIRLIEKELNDTVIVTNCDILIEADYGEILRYHKHSGNAMTIVSSLKNITVPYGVLHAIEQGFVTSMEEKPCISCFVNTGMYYVEPQYLEMIPKGVFFHMTDLAEKIMNEGLKVGMYPISENSFLDMGQIEEMKKMEEKLSSGFSS